MSTNEPKWNDNFLDSYRMIADPLADGIVSRLIAENGQDEARKLFEVLIRNIDMPLSELPEYAQQFLGDSMELPEWADPKLILEGEKVFMEHGPIFLTILFYKSLPTLYACWRGSKVLAMTGRLQHNTVSNEVFQRRIAETAQFLVDVMQPGGLAPGGKGILTAQKVRMVHASIRHFIPADKWDETNWGKPICQEDLAYTLLTFSISLLDGLRSFGIKLSDVEEKAFFHSWKVCGHLIGVNENLIPEDVADARALLAIELKRQSAASAEGVMLTQALLEFAKGLIPGKVFDHSPEIIMRHLVGDEMADMLQVKTAGGCMTAFIPAFMKTILGLSEKLERNDRPMNELIDKLSQKILYGMVGYFNKEKKQNFKLPIALKKMWKIN